MPIANASMGASLIPEQIKYTPKEKLPSQMASE
jgi:hypothetical protein